MTQPPIAKIVPKTITTHGDTRSDPYFWLREKSNPEVVAYLEAENEYAHKMMQPAAQLQSELYAEMVSRIQEDDMSVPERLDDYHYYTRLEKGKAYPLYCRKQGNLEAKEEVYLDQNLLAQHQQYLSLGTCQVSPSHKLLAYSVDTSGAESYTLYIQDLATRRIVDTIPNTASMEWAADSQTVFYTTLDAARRPYQVFRHVLGSPISQDTLMYHEKEEAFHLWVTLTKSKKYLLLNCKSKTTAEVWYLEADKPQGQFAVIQPRQHQMKYFADHSGDCFFIVTNDDAKNFKLVQAPVSMPGKKNWTEILPHKTDVRIHSLDAFAEHLVSYERQNGLKTLRIISLRTRQEHLVKFPEPVYHYEAGLNHDFHTKQLRLQYNSLVTPPSFYDYDMDKQSWELKKQNRVGDYDPSLYQCERILATASDGTQIPISLVYKKGMRKTGSNPLYLHGYGAYGISTDPEFQAHRISLLSRGFIYAMAHIRGGEELGRHWYEDGKLLKKQNTFTDFIACAEHLIQKKYTNPDKLAIFGRSAGGLLIGAVVNMRPDLFKAVRTEVPFVDMLNTILDPSLPLTVIEYEEWGNPNDQAFYEYMRQYSPYDNVQRQRYPHMLITAGLNDSRVSYWEPAKWVARLRTMKTDDNQLLFKTNMGAGHTGRSGRYDELQDTALAYAFIIRALEVDKKQRRATASKTRAGKGRSTQGRK